MGDDTDLEEWLTELLAEKICTDYLTWWTAGVVPIVVALIGVWAIKRKKA